MSIQSHLASYYESSVRRHGHFNKHLNGHPNGHSHEDNSTHIDTSDHVEKSDMLIGYDIPRSPRSKEYYTLGICAMEKKARSKPMQSILTRLCATNHFKVVYFEESMIKDLAVESWPRCDFLIAFYSNGFPLDKAIDYVKLRQPYCINDLILQEALKDRRLVLRILDAHNIPTAPRIVVSRDGGPKMSAELAERLKHINDACYLPRPREPSTKSDVSSSETANTARGLIALESSDAEQRAQVPDTPDTFAQIDENTIRQGIYTLSKPFVEKPVDGDNHNIYIYYRTEDGGGARQLFRKVENKSSEFNPTLTHIRTGDSYIYEQFMKVNNAEDVKVYTVGDGYAHAETRKSPVVDGQVVRDKNGKEVRTTTELSPEEKEIARKVCRAFGQTICGFDLLRVGGKSYVIDVNGWSFVKGNETYYDQCATILRSMLLQTAHQRRHSLSLPKGTGLGNLYDRAK